MPLNRYQEIILRDVQQPGYEKQKKWVWGVFGLIGCLFGGIYFVSFHPGLANLFRFLFRMYNYSLITTDKAFKTTVYHYQYLLLFVLFAGIVAVFAVLTLFAYDMQARNGVIQHLLDERASGQDAAAASKKAAS